MKYADLLPIGSLETNLREFWIKIQKVKKKNTYGNVICKANEYEWYLRGENEIN